MTTAEFKALSEDKQREYEYGVVKGLFIRKAREEAAIAIDYVDHLGIANDELHRKGNRERLLGWMMCLSCCYEMGSATQARSELQVVSEQTKFGADLANQIHSLALDIKGKMDDILHLEAAYCAVLHARKHYNTHYLNDDGESVGYSEKELEILAEENRKYLDWKEKVAEGRKRILDDILTEERAILKQEALTVGKQLELNLG